ncbi:hypothetical protein F3J14_09800 [Burkholderia sp. Tr-862]|uniref:hypothetical protein n=1 Tax=Burkholderia sp. Tr-862 TaxID=2608331 RepID=UPI00141918E9|nr:hypothetical protein [Burkholderia sp. Tr-862]NIF41174.1 hypothetical protein [Burkholderia sp. Tr-862]
MEFDDENKTYPFFHLSTPPMKIRTSTGRLLPVLLAGTGLTSGHAEEAPRPELGCLIRKADGYPIESADLTFQQRILIARCMNASARAKQTESMRLKSERQTIENMKNFRRAEEDLSRLGFGAAMKPYVPPRRTLSIP